MPCGRSAGPDTRCEPGHDEQFHIRGLDPVTMKPFAYYETVAGGMGARPTMNGLAGIHTHMTNSMNTPVEALEYAYPVSYRPLLASSNSGGVGQWRGGEGVIRQIPVSYESSITVLSDRRKFAPYGLQGGEDGRRGSNVLMRTDGTKEQLKSKVTT